MPPQFIYFDVDDTLLDHRQAERRALADVRRAFPEAFERCSEEDLQRTYHTHNAPLWAQYADGEIEKDELKKLRFERLLSALTIETLDPATAGAHYLERYAAHWAFPDAAQRAFRALAERFRVGLLTNGFAETQHAKLKRFPELRRRAEAVVISEEVGRLKPHPEIFAHATEKAGVPTEAILYVGDSYRSDVEGGLRAGWQVAWYGGDAREAPPGVFCFDRWETLTARLLDFV